MKLSGNPRRIKFFAKNPRKNKIWSIKSRGIKLVAKFPKIPRFCQETQKKSSSSQKSPEKKYFGTNYLKNQEPFKNFRRNPNVGNEAENIEKLTRSPKKQGVVKKS